MKSKAQHIEELFNSIGQLRRLFEAYAQESGDEKVASYMQFATLKYLKHHPNSTVGDIAGCRNLSKSSATQLIERLVKSGLVKRIHDKEDRRIVRLAITAVGDREMLAQRKNYIHKISKLFANVPDEDLEELVRIHSSLINSFQKEQKV